MSETSKTATLVGTPGMLAPGANVLTATLPRGEIEGALALDPPAELILDVLRTPEGSTEAERKTVSVVWKRKDLEYVLEDRDADAFTFWFDPAELEAAIEGSEVEGHGLRETAAVLTIAAAAAAAGASGAMGAVHEEASLTERGIGVTAAATVHTEASLTERGITPGTPSASHDEATFAARGIDAGSPAASHDEATFTARGIDTGSPAASHDEATLTARGIDTGSPAVHDEATFAARGIDAGTVPARHDEATFAARGIDPGTIQAVHEEASLTARGIDTGAPPVTTDTGSGIEISVAPETVAGVTGAVVGAGLLIAAAAFASRRREPGTA
jgi:hypothetical protein